MDLTDWIRLSDGGSSGGGGGMPTTPPLAWRGDWLNFWFDGRRYYIGDQDAQDGPCQKYREQGYTDVLVGTVWPEDDPELPAYNFVRDPQGWVNRAKGFNDRGLRTVLCLSFEGARNAWREHAGTYLDDLKRFLDVAVPSGSAFSAALLPEPREMWHWDYQLQIVQILNTYRLDFALHDGETAWGPQGRNADHPNYVWHTGEMGWWKTVTDASPDVKHACAFQYRNYSQSSSRRKNHGFLSPDWDVYGGDSHTAALLDRRRLPALGVEFIAGEYAWNGTDPNEVVVSEDEGRTLGQRALLVEVEGRTPIGAINGC